MTVGIGGGGFVGIALETTSGTYLAPTKFVPIMSESLHWTQDTVFRRPIRQTVDVVGAVTGNGHVEGDLQMEAFEDVVPYFLTAARTAMVPTGTTPNFVYTFTGTAAAVPVKTMSITIVRNGEAFGYVGCVVGSYTFTVEDGLLRFNCTIVGNSEATQTLPTATWVNTQTPFGAGKYVLEIPTATQIFDADGFSFQVEDNATPQTRLKDVLGSQFVSFGERAATLSLDRDFQTRADYDAFKALTAHSVTLKAVKGVNNSISLTLPAAIKDTYEIGLSGQGDLIRASIAYQAVLDATANAYTIAIKTQEVLP